MRDWIAEWEDHLKKVVKEALYETFEELEAEQDEIGKDRDVTIFKLPCKHCSKPITSGQPFVLFHGECLDKEQDLR